MQGEGWRGGRGGKGGREGREGAEKEGGAASSGRPLAYAGPGHRFHTSLSPPFSSPTLPPLISCTQQPLAFAPLTSAHR